MGVAQGPEATLLMKKFRDSDVGGPEARLGEIKTIYLTTRASHQAYPDSHFNALAGSAQGLRVDSFKPSFDSGTEPVSRGQRHRDSSRLRNGLCELRNQQRVKLRITSHCL